VRAGKNKSGKEPLGTPAWHAGGLTLPGLAEGTCRNLQQWFAVLRIFQGLTSEKRTGGGQAGELARLMDKAQRRYAEALEACEADALTAARLVVACLEDVVFALHRAQSLAADLARRVHIGELTTDPASPQSEDYSASAQTATGDRIPLLSKKAADNLEAMRDALYHYEDRLKSPTAHPGAWSPIACVEGLWADGHLLPYALIVEAIFRLSWATMVLVAAVDVSPVL
jgi:hypothetical protein